MLTASSSSSLIRRLYRARERWVRMGRAALQAMLPAYVLFTTRRGHDEGGVARSAMCAKRASAETTSVLDRKPVAMTLPLPGNTV